MKHKLFNDVYPYTYYIRRISDGLQYYGSRYSNVNSGLSPLDDLGKRYFSSGKFKKEFEKFPQNFQYKICDTFDTVDECIKHESRIVSKIYKRNSWINANRNHFPPGDDLSVMRKKSMLLKYGVDHNFKLESVKRNKKETFLKKYGVDNPSKSRVVVNKMKETNLKKFGVEWPVQSEVIKKKIKESIFRKYGSEGFGNDVGVICKTKNTNLMKYGTEYSFQSQLVIDKIHEKRREMYIRFAKMTDLEFTEYLSKISQHASVQSQKKVQRNKGVELLNNSGGVL